MGLDAALDFIHPILSREEELTDLYEGQLTGR